MAIGGITLERAAEIYRAGADSLAVVRDLIVCADPGARAEHFLAEAARAAAGVRKHRSRSRAAGAVSMTYACKQLRLRPPRRWPQPNTAFIRGLGLFDSTMIVVGSMIGSGIFIVSADIARQTGSAGGLLIAWIDHRRAHRLRRAFLRRTGRDDAARRAANTSTCANPIRRSGVFSTAGRFFW